VAPQYTTNKQFTKSLGHAFSPARPTIIPIPSFAISLLFGPDRALMLLGGQKVVPKQLLHEGYHFNYPAIDGALKELVTPFWRWSDQLPR
jgi:NAD dependent epimerase/dehydratase family enzyme